MFIFCFLKYKLSCRWANHMHRVLKRFIETKVPPGFLIQPSSLSRRVVLWNKLKDIAKADIYKIYQG
jgi:hypothetical protein